MDSDTVLSWMSAISAMLNLKLDTKLDGFERKIVQLDSQRQLLEDLKTGVSLLRKTALTRWQDELRHFK